ncbi:hypothetical protein ONZ45_g114 [Pleurotus djamor]|nr:hypothetical protein ONZ45_g114 [Pleurotus djamor]
MSNNHLTNDAYSGASTRTRPFLNPISTLPTIVASPVCTPASLQPSDSTASDSSARSRPEHPAQVRYPPTWMSTPPTPPPELVRRSVTCRTRRPPGPIITSSSSLPVPSHAPARVLKRRASIAAMYTWRLRSLSDASYNANHAEHEAFSRASSPLRAALLVPFEYSEYHEHLRSRPSAPIFHIPSDPVTDTDEADPVLCESPVDAVPPPLAEAALLLSNGRATDNMRRLHGLLELLTTEIGYLLDLRTLVSIYIQQLPLLAARPLSRSHSSFSAITRVGSFTYVTSPAAQTLTPVEGSFAAQQSKDKEPLRPLFSEDEIALLTRNIDDILELHEHFVEELRIAVSPFGLSGALTEADAHSERHYSETYEQMASNVEAAIKAVCTKFAIESSRFNAYQSFCARHPEALDLIRKVQNQYPLEWHDFEQRCSKMLSSLSEGGAKHEVPSQPPSPGELIPSRKRTSSLTSIDGAVRTLRSKAGIRSRDTFAFPAEPLRDPAKSPHRLAFMDYMIKPVQRICKYPLLLDQLLPRKHVSAPSCRKTDVHVVVESATQAMRHVAGSVDEARHKQDVTIQSNLVASRMTLMPSLPGGAQSSSPLQGITPPFMSSLGTCLLTGPLDVIHHPSGKPLGSRSKFRAKCLGAFLYMGGYFILAKVAKSKAYDPRHWVSLSEFDIINVRDDEALLPYSFRFISTGHQFELSASCQAEKEVWLQSLQQAMSQTPKWVDEPTPSIHCDGRGDLVPSSLDGGPFESINALPTIQSIPELVNNDSAGSTESAPAVLTTEHSHPVKEDLSSISAPPSRRSSATSVRSIFSPTPSELSYISVSRPSPAAKAIVEQGLHDVISEACLLARSRIGQSEDDVHSLSRRKSRSSLTMSSIGLGKHRTGNDGVHIFRRRSLLETTDTFGRKSVSRTKSLAIRRQAKKPPLISTFYPSSPSSEPSSSGPRPIAIKPISSSNPPSASSSPSEPQTPPIILKDELAKDSKPRHIVGSMREFFHPRSASPVSPSVPDSSEEVDFAGKTVTPSLLRRWAQGTLNSHRRAHSAPDEDGKAPMPEQFDPDCDIVIDTLTTKTPETLVVQPEEAPIIPHNTHKRMSFFQRLKSIEVG